MDEYQKNIASRIRGKTHILFHHARPLVGLLGCPQSLGHVWGHQHNANLWTR